MKTTLVMACIATGSALVLAAGAILPNAAASAAPTVAASSSASSSSASSSTALIGAQQLLSDCGRRMPSSNLAAQMSSVDGCENGKPRTPALDEDVLTVTPDYPAKFTIDGRDAPSNSAKRVRVNIYQAGQNVPIVCQANGDLKAGSRIWDKTSDNVWVPDAYVKTGTDGFISGMSRCSVPESKSTPKTKKPSVKWPAKYTIDGRDVPTNSAKRVRVNIYKAGQGVPIVCQAIGDSKAGSRIWDKTSDNVWVPDAYVKTGTDGFISGMKRCSTTEPVGPKQGPTTKPTPPTQKPTEKPKPTAEPNPKPVPPTPKKPAKKVRVVAMGDSYASGEGVGVYYPSTDRPGKNQCHRSPLSWQRLVMLPGTLGITNNLNPKLDYVQVACSGAETADILNRSRYGEKPQIQELNGTEDYVLLSIGGNDAGFGPVMENCIKHLNCQKRAPFLDSKAKIPGVVTSIEGTLRKIDHKSGHAKIVLAGYPMLLGPGIGCTGFEPAEAASIDVLTMQFGVATMLMVHRLHTEGIDVQYVMTSPAFLGHGACAGPGMAWINALPGGIVRSGASLPQGVMHPNARGQAAYAATVTAALAFG